MKPREGKDFVYKYAIRIQRRADFKGGDRKDWRNWRQFSVWPVLFDTEDDADAAMKSCFTFKGMRGRKLGAVIVSRRVNLRKNEMKHDDPCDDCSHWTDRLPRRMEE